MEEAIKHYLNQSVLEKSRLENGWKESWLITLQNRRKVVFRACTDYAELFEREKFFYDTVNRNIGKICPEVYIVDGSCRYYHKSFQISEYIEGKTLRRCLQEEFDISQKQAVYYELGQLTARINQIAADPDKMYSMGRAPWAPYYSNQLMRPHLQAITANGLIRAEEVDRLCEKMQSYPVRNTNRLLHRDIRPDNLIFRNGRIFVIDAETCEIGDPLNELARIRLEWHYWEYYDLLLKGYQSVSHIDPDGALLDFYQLEALGEVLDMHYNYGCGNSATPFFRDCFLEIKEKLLRD